MAGLVALMTLLVLANAAIGAFGGYVLRRTAESVVLAARRGLLSRLLRLRLSAVERHEPGDLMSRVTSDTTLLREVIIATLVGGVTGVLTLGATVVLMGLLDVVMLAVTVVALGLAVVVIALVVPRINRASRQAQESVGLIGAALERMFGAFRTVKASGAEEREGQRLDAAATDAWRASVRAAMWNAIAGNTAGLSIQVAFIAVLAVGGARVAGGSITVGDPRGVPALRVLPHRPGQPARRCGHAVPRGSRRGRPHPRGRGAAGRGRRTARAPARLAAAHRCRSPSRTSRSGMRRTFRSSTTASASSSRRAG